MTEPEITLAAGGTDAPARARRLWGALRATDRAGIYNQTVERRSLRHPNARVNVVVYVDDWALDLEVHADGRYSLVRRPFGEHARRDRDDYLAEGTLPEASA